MKVMHSGSNPVMAVLILISSFLAAFVVIRSITGSQEIAFALALLCASLPYFIAAAQREKARIRMESVWPEVIDGVISALHSGRTINESLIDLEKFGPKILAPTWSRISQRITSGEDLGKILSEESSILKSSRADQFFATLIFAKQFGGSSIQSSLRHLSAFLRDDQQMRDEIDTRFGWVRNSALLAAGAPWLLLLLLAAQPGTIAAFATFGGKVVLSIGVIATALAYVWMKRVSRLPKGSQLFAFQAGHSDA